MSIDLPLTRPARRVAFNARQRGVTLIEQIIFIVIVSVGVVGLVSTMNPLIGRSADPMQTKQLMAIAESVLSEVIHQPFTWCDPDEVAASTALSYADCTNPQSSATAGEGRSGGAGVVFDNVADYHNWNMNDVTDAGGGNPMAGYNVAVAVANAGGAMGVANDAALSVTVTVTRGAETYALTGYRFRYAPRY